MLLNLIIYKNKKIRMSMTIRNSYLLNYFSCNTGSHHYAIEPINDFFV